ncbi:hypothetical protein PLESTB_000772500 [Pleodorina starrii]|uniref:Uncharacterized protein n=1 Tax=Pleodorina starrii TaxID=330485 RepID=A0A9W6BK88_9CHLO|nr:hypothetical protein PLESTM_000432900 [Pleodorina starrii]GLC53649.1 hypothetical protein PLESTB_000772500 [Pleodorina starrii]GLC65655.1 hypothetical protein PLESTF_000325800 [Pleodorina starrii]
MGQVTPTDPHRPMGRSARPTCNYDTDDAQREGPRREGQTGRQAARPAPVFRYLCPGRRHGYSHRNSRTEYDDWTDCGAAATTAAAAAVAVVVRVGRPPRL